MSSSGNVWVVLRIQQICNTTRYKSPIYGLFTLYKRSQGDRISGTHISRKAHISRVTEVVESCQMCWNLHRMQQICNKYINMYRTFFSSDTGKCPFLRVSTSGATDSK